MQVLKYKCKRKRVHLNHLFLTTIKHREVTENRLQAGRLNEIFSWLEFEATHRLINFHLFFVFAVVSSSQNAPATPKSTSKRSTVPVTPKSASRRLNLAKTPSSTTK